MKLIVKTISNKPLHFRAKNYAIDSVLIIANSTYRNIGIWALKNRIPNVALKKKAYLCSKCALLIKFLINFIFQHMPYI